MRGRTGLFLALAVAAGISAAVACGDTPAVEWSLPVNGVPFSCAYDADKSSQMDAEIDKHRDNQRGGNLSEKWQREEEKVRQLQILAPQTANLASGVTFNVADGIENIFDFYMDVSGPRREKANFICDKVEVFNNEGYVVIFGSDGHPPNSPPAIAKDGPYSVAYVFKAQPSGMELVGFVPNHGHHRFATIVKGHSGLGDLLVLGSSIQYSPNEGEVKSYQEIQENNWMLSSIAQDLGFPNRLAADVAGVLDDGAAKVTVHSLSRGRPLLETIKYTSIGGGLREDVIYRIADPPRPITPQPLTVAPPPFSFKYRLTTNTSEKIISEGTPTPIPMPTPCTPSTMAVGCQVGTSFSLEELAARHVYSGRDPKIENMAMVEEGGKPKLALTVSVETPAGGRYNVRSGTFDIGQLVTDGIISTAPLFRK